MCGSVWSFTNVQPMKIDSKCIWLAGDVKEPVHLSKRVGHVVPGVVV